MAGQQTAALATMFGGKPEWPSLDQRLEELDEMLVSPVKASTLDRAEVELRDMLGLRGHRSG